MTKSQNQNPPSRSRRRLFQCLLVVLILLISAVARGQTLDEYDVKAAFIFNLTKFVEWPEASATASFSICILGDDPFGASIDGLKEKVVNGRKIVIHRLKDVSEVSVCDMVFVSSAERARGTRLLETIRGTQILTVGETNDFLRLGGMFQLLMRNSRVNLVINSDAVEASPLKISAKLLSVAQIFKPRQDGR